MMLIYNLKVKVWAVLGVVINNYVNATTMSEIQYPYIHTYKNLINIFHKFTQYWNYTLVKFFLVLPFFVFASPRCWAKQEHSHFAPLNLPKERENTDEVKIEATCRKCKRIYWECLLASLLSSLSTSSSTS